jgi:putative transposase
MSMVKKKNIHLTRKIRIYPTPEQESVLWELSNQCRLLYNFALAERKNAWESEKRNISYSEQQNQLPLIKEKYPKYNQVYSKVLQMTLNSLDSNYKSFFKLIKIDPSARPPGFRGKKYFFTMKYNQSGFKYENNKIKLSHHVENGAPLVFDIPNGITFAKIKQVEVLQDHKGNWFLSIIDEPIAPTFEDNGLYQAWDLGVSKHVGVNMGGKFIEVKNIRSDKYWNPVIDKIQSRRDHCKKNKHNASNRWVHLNIIKHKFERKRTNQIKDFQHKASLMIVKNTKSKTIIIGDLNVKSMPKSKQANRSINRSTQGTGYLGRFADFLTYKSELIGKTTTKVSEKYSTQTCCCCGKRQAMPLSRRVMSCDCGNEIDRDRNSAINIMLEFLSQNAMCTGYQRFVDNLRKTGVDIIRPLHSQEAPCVSVV